MLIDCPECHGKVSTEAKSCPHCGHPLKKPRVSRRLRILLVVLAVVIVGTYGYRESISKVVVDMWTQPEWTVSGWMWSLLEPFRQQEDLTGEDDSVDVPIQMLVPAQFPPQSQDEEMQHRTMTRRQLERFAGWVEAYYLVRKELPSDLESVAWSMGFIEYFRQHGSLFRDGWGNAIRYRASEGKVEMFSNGPDEVAGTADDILLSRQFEGAAVGTPMRKINRRDLMKFKEAYYQVARRGTAK